LRSTARFAISVIVSGGISLGLARVLRRPLEVQTDIVGYPIYANFNGFNYFTQYYVMILCFPLVALVVYELVGRVWPRSSWPEGAPVTADVELPRSVRSLLGVLPSLAVGASLGTVWLLSSDSAAKGLFLVPIGTAVVYAGVVWGVGRVVGRLRGREGLPLTPLINVALAPFTLLLLEVISRETWVALLQPPSIQRYAPIPLGVTLGLLGMGLVWAVLRLRRVGTAADLRRLETVSVLLIVVPVLLLTYTAAISRPLAAVDLFHQGEFVGAAHLVSHGAFPWRDVLFIHGLLQDVFIPWLGFLTFGRTIWGAWSGLAFWATPAWWLAYYALFVYLFSRRPLLLLATLAIPFIGAFPYAHHRFTLFPLILLALAALLRRPGWLQAFGLAASLLLANVLVPELAYGALAGGAVLLCYEWSRKDRGTRLQDRLAGTWRFSVAAGVLLSFWCAFLQRHRALGPFVDYYRTFAPGHELTGAVPLYRFWFDDPYFVTLMVLPPVSVVLMFWYVVSRRRQRVPLEERDWVMIAATLVTAAYYKKFLSRADWHVAQAAAPALPLVFFLADRGLSAVQRLVVPRARRWVPVVGAAVILAWVAQPSSLGYLSWQGQLGTHYHVQVSMAPPVAEFGWSEKGVEPAMQEVSTLRTFLQREMRKGEPIFDFTNQPALYHFLLDLQPASRFFHVSMAIRRRSQEQLIADLERSRPRLVAYETEHGGLAEWDGVTNVVRHYEVSRYILDNYVPLTKVAGQTLYVARQRTDGGGRPGLTPSQVADEAAGQRCDWGYAPFHLESQRMEAGPEGHVVSAIPAVRLAASGWAALAGGSAPAKEIVAISDGMVRGRSAAGDYRADVAHELGPAAASSGFRMFAEWEHTGQQRPQITLLAMGDEERAGELFTQASGARPAAQHLPEELAHVRVLPGAMVGNVETFALTSQSILKVEFPRDVSLSTFAAIEMEIGAKRSGSIAASGISPEEGAQTQLGAVESRALSATVPRTEGVHVRIPADNCPSWRANSGSTLFIRSDEGIELRSIRLLRRPE
jgi:hypothetical protein